MQSPSSKKIEHLWRNDITGLRALAVLPVLLFHSFPEFLPGGFFGVDVFFVISGYLISGIIFRGLIDGTFSYKNFYEKRIKRILPNLLLLIIFVSVMGYFFLLPSEYLNLGKHIYSSAGFFQNFRLLDEVGYFTEDALRKPLLHLWSLAIEEQFYIVFPIICSLIWRFSRSRTFIAGAVFFITAGSLVACLLVQDRNFNFYFPLTRFWELGAGICLAFVECYGFFRTSHLALGFRNFLSCVGLVGILAPMVFWSTDMTHPGWITLIPVLGAVFMIAANPDASVNRTLLSWRPMTFVGLISYSLYLWHWPLLAFLFICVPNASSVWTIVALTLSFVLATAVYFFVENPVRRSKNICKISTSAMLLIGLVLAVIFGQTLRRMDGFPNRNTLLGHTVESIRAVGEWDAFNKAQKINYEGIEIASPDRSNFPSIIFVGDSHIAQYYLRAQYLSDQTGQSFGFIGKTGCFILSSVGCAKESKAISKLILDSRVKVIVIGSIWGERSELDDFKISVMNFKKMIAKRPDLRVYVILDYPWTPPRINYQQGDYDPLKHLNRFSFSKKLDEKDFIVSLPNDKSWEKGNIAITGLLSDVATIIPVTPYVCPNNKCNLLKWYRDDDHLQPLRLEKEAIWLDQIFEGGSVGVNENPILRK